MSAAPELPVSVGQERRLSLRLPAMLVAELEAVARENDRSLSAEARLALKAWLAQYDKRSES